MGGFVTQVVVPVIGVLGLVVVILIFAVALGGTMEWLDTTMERAKRRRRGEAVPHREPWDTWKRAWEDARHPKQGTGGPGVGTSIM